MTPEESKKRRREYYEKNKHLVIERAMVWAAENKARRKEIALAYYYKNHEENKTVGRETAARYRSSIPEKVNARQRAWRNKNVEAAREYQREWNKKNKKRMAEYRKKYQEENKDRCIELARLSRQRRRDKPGGKIEASIRKRIFRALKGKAKSENSISLIGCSIEELKSHLESLFKPGMTWENYGYRGWHIDHKIPCAAFDLEKPEQQKICFHYTNLQPLWMMENLTKNSRLQS